MRVCHDWSVDKSDQTISFRMKFLTKKWQKAIKSLSISGSVNGHAPGELTNDL